MYLWDFFAHTIGQRKCLLNQNKPSLFYFLYTKEEKNIFIFKEITQNSKTK